MTQTEEKYYSFEEYCQYQDDFNHLYELVDNRLILMNPPTVRHIFIAKFLEKAFDEKIAQKKLSWVCFREAGVRTSLRKSRICDLFVTTQASALELLDKSAIFQSPPLLIVEIVSPDSITRDYRYKRSEYAALGVDEYWIVDPKNNKVTVLLLEEGLYEETIFVGDNQVRSRQFVDFNLTVNQILAAGNL